MCNRNVTYLYRKSKLAASECAPLFTYLLAFQHLAVSNSYLIYTTTLQCVGLHISRPGLGLETDQDHFLRSWSWSWSRPCWSWSWSRPPWSWSLSRSLPVWSWSGLGLGLPGLDNISGKIIKIVVTRCQILRLKYTKFNFGWGSAPDPAYSAPQTP